MYYSYTVPIPEIQGKIRIKNDTYVELEKGRIYIPETQHNQPIRVSIGKIDSSTSGYMFPNEKYYEEIPDAVHPEVSSHTRSKCLRVGTYIVIKKLIKELKLDSIIKDCEFKQEGLILDLSAYLIVEQDNAGQYYPDYAYCHPLFSKGMHIYSDSTVSNFFHEITDDQRLLFLEEWNEDKNHEAKIYISYDSTNRNCQAGEVTLAEFGHAKDDESKPVVNYSIIYDTNNRVPLLYENYPGSIPDISQLSYMTEKLIGYGYFNFGLIIDRGYFSKENLQFLDRKGVPFIIMVKGVRACVEAAIRAVKGTFENNRACRNRKYRVYGATVKQKLYETDSKDRYFHIFYSDIRGAREREEIEEKVATTRRKLDKLIGKKFIFIEGPQESDDPSDTENTREMTEEEKASLREEEADEKKEIEKNKAALNRIAHTNYFDLIFDKEGILAAVLEKNDVINEEKDSCGYFSIISSEEMTADRALTLYKGRDPSEKLFCADKSFLGNHASRIHTEESEEGKILVQFLALLIRQKLYTCLLDENLKQPSPLNYMNVPAAIRELEKIEMTQQPDGTYRLDWAVTATQKKILAAFGMTEANIKAGAKEISDFLRKPQSSSNVASSVQKTGS